MIQKNKKLLFIVGFIALSSLFFTIQLVTKSSQKERKHSKKTLSINTQWLAFEWDSINSSLQLSNQIDSVLRHENLKNHFNGSVLVAKGDHILFNNEYGFTDFSRKDKLNETSSFQLASVSKQFTAVAIMMLVEQDSIALDDSLTNYFPEFPYPNITIRHLLNHTAGLPMYFWLAEHKWREKRIPCDDDIMCLLEEYHLPASFKPGRRFHYSNTGYFILAHLVEVVSRMSLRDFLRVNVFEQLDMTNTYVYRYGQDSIIPQQLTGYYKRGWRYYSIPGTVNDGVVGDKNVYSTASDLHKWIQGLNSGKLISTESLAQIYTKGTTNRGREIPYGFGFRISGQPENELIFHNGKWNGFSTTIRQYIQDDLLIIILDHSSYSKISSLAEELRLLVKKSSMYNVILPLNKKFSKLN